MREAALALGYTKWRTSLSVVLRTALPGIVTGALVAVARIAGETAPLIFTAFGNQFWSLSPTQPIAAIPMQIYTYAMAPYDDWNRQAWAGALVLLALVFVISLAARFAKCTFQRWQRRTRRSIAPATRSTTRRWSR